MKTKPKKRPTKIDRRMQAALNEILLRNLRRLDVTADQRAMIASILLASGKGQKREHDYTYPADRRAETH
jgi:hypothetical protein